MTQNTFRKTVTGALMVQCTNLLLINSRKGASTKITFTKEQYETLLKAVYMGNWRVSSTSEEPEKNFFDALGEYVFSFAKDLIFFQEG